MYAFLFLGDLIPIMVFFGIVMGIWAVLSMISNRNSRAMDRLSRLSRPQSLADIEDPAGTIAIFDARPGYSEIWEHRQTDAYFNASGQCAWEWSSPAPASDPERCRSGHVAKRHNEGFCAGFVDGHSKWIKNSTPAQWTVRAD